MPVILVVVLVLLAMATAMLVIGTSRPSIPVIDRTGTALEPLPPDPAFEAAAARELCLDRSGFESLPGNPAFQDRRTPDRAYIQFSDEFKYIGCLLRATGDGTFDLESNQSGPHFNSSGTDFGVTYFAAIDSGGFLVGGPVPGDVADVWLEREDGLLVRASKTHGRFVAWWLGDSVPEFVIGESPGGAELRRVPIPDDFFR
jgi:hypothetical protein